MCQNLAQMAPHHQTKYIASLRPDNVQAYVIHLVNENEYNIRFIIFMLSLIWVARAGQGGYDSGDVHSI
jgi:hypothetical protein